MSADESEWSDCANEPEDALAAVREENTLDAWLARAREQHPESPEIEPGVSEAKRLSADREKAAAHAVAAALPEERLRDIGDLSKQCSFPMRPDAIAASDTCRKHASSGVTESPRESNTYWRCSEHYGLLKPGVEGFVITHVIHLTRQTEDERQHERTVRLSQRDRASIATVIEDAALSTQAHLTKIQQDALKTTGPT